MLGIVVGIIFFGVIVILFFWFYFIEVYFKCIGYVYVECLFEFVCEIDVLLL